jgi:hypothetical protein
LAGVPAALQPQAYAVRDADLSSAVIMHDSFTWDLLPLISQRFSRSVFVQGYPLNWEVIDREQPDLVFKLSAGVDGHVANVERHSEECSYQRWSIHLEDLLPQSHGGRHAGPHCAASAGRRSGSLRCAHRSQTCTRPESVNVRAG